MEDGREEKKEKGEKEEAKLERDGMKIDNILDKGEKSHAQKRKAEINDENGNKIESDMCREFHRNDRGRVVRCTRCMIKRYCISCFSRWYPRMDVGRGFCRSLPCLSQNLQLQELLAIGWYN